MRSMLQIIRVGAGATDTVGARLDEVKRENRLSIRSQPCAAPIAEAGIANFTPARLRWSVRKKS